MSVTEPMTDPAPRSSFGWDVGPSVYGPRGIIAKPDTSGTGNLVLRVGTENVDTSTGVRRSWSQVAHVVLTPAEAAEFVAACTALLCTGERYLVNPDAPEEGTDIHHEGPCPVHPAVA